LGVDRFFAIEVLSLNPGTFSASAALPIALALSIFLIRRQQKSSKPERGASVRCKPGRSI
jgi:hypothetical protein